MRQVQKSVAFPRNGNIIPHSFLVQVRQQQNRKKNSEIFSTSGIELLSCHLGRLTLIHFLFLLMCIYTIIVLCYLTLVSTMIFPSISMLYFTFDALLVICISIQFNSFIYIIRTIYKQRSTH